MGRTDPPRLVGEAPVGALGSIGRRRRENGRDVREIAAHRRDHGHIRAERDDLEGVRAAGLAVVRIAGQGPGIARVAAVLLRDLGVMPEVRRRLGLVQANGPRRGPGELERQYEQQQEQELLHRIVL